MGVEDGSHGVVNVTDKGHWNFLGTGEAFRYIYIGDAGDGELNVSREGKVDSGIITAGMKKQAQATLLLRITLLSLISELILVMTATAE